VRGNERPTNIEPDGLVVSVELFSQHAIHVARLVSGVFVLGLCMRRARDKPAASACRLLSVVG
jgi:hypothetical protein